jgi:hypothetical protein
MLIIIYFGTHNNKIHTIYKQTSVVVLVLLAKQQQPKIVNLYTFSVCYAWALGGSQAMIIHKPIQFCGPT